MCKNWPDSCISEHFDDLQEGNFKILLLLKKWILSLIDSKHINLNIIYIIDSIVYIIINNLFTYFSSISLQVSHRSHNQILSKSDEFQVRESNDQKGYSVNYFVLIWGFKKLNIFVILLFSASFFFFFLVWLFAVVYFFMRSRFYDFGKRCKRFWEF